MLYRGTGIVRRRNVTRVMLSPVAQHEEPLLGYSYVCLLGCTTQRALSRLRCRTASTFQHTRHTCEREPHNTNEIPEHARIEETER